MRPARRETPPSSTTGWRFETGWFQTMSGLQWAWFSRETVDGETQDES